MHFRSRSDSILISVHLIDQVVTLISVGILAHVVSSLISACHLDQDVTLV